MQIYLLQVFTIAFLVLAACTYIPLYFKYLYKYRRWEPRKTYDEGCQYDKDRKLYSTPELRVHHDHTQFTTSLMKYNDYPMNRSACEPLAQHQVLGKHDYTLECDDGTIELKWKNAPLYYKVYGYQSKWPCSDVKAMDFTSFQKKDKLKVVLMVTHKNGTMLFFDSHSLPRCWLLYEELTPFWCEISYTSHIDIVSLLFATLMSLISFALLVARIVGATCVNDYVIYDSNAKTTPMTTKDGGANGSAMRLQENDADDDDYYSDLNVARRRGDRDREPLLTGPRI